MSIFNTFYLLYKSNAEDAIKGNKAVEKSTKDTQRALNNTNDTTKEIGLNFVKMAEGAAAAIGAIGGFEFLKAGVQNSIDLNTNLKLNAENLKMTAQQLRSAGEAAKQFGGTAEQGQSDALRMAEANYLVGSTERDPKKMFANLRNRVSGMNDRQKYFFLKSLGLSTSGIRQVGIVQNDEFNAGWKTADKLVAGTNAAADKAYGANKLENEVSGQKDSFFNRLLIAISAPLDSFLKRLGDIVGGTGAAGGSAAVIGGTTVGGWLLAKKISKFFKSGAGATGEAATGAGRAVVGGGVEGGAVATGGGMGMYGEGAAEVAGGLTLAGAAIPTALAAVTIGAVVYDAYKIKQIINAYKGMRQRQALAKTLNTGDPDIDFWTNQGYSKEQAAGIMANMQAESGGHSGAVGDGGKAHGLFQWHAQRRASILKGTGIDINSASHAEQLRAAAWEMKNGNVGFNDSYFRTLDSADKAGAYFATNFEHPANALSKSISRGKSALAIASQLSPASSGGMSIKIDRIDVHTQATDANAIAAGIGGALENKLYTALGFIAGNIDNGQSR